VDFIADGCGGGATLACKVGSRGAQGKGADEKNGPAILTAVSARDRETAPHPKRSSAFTERIDCLIAAETAI